MTNFDFESFRQETLKCLESDDTAEGSFAVKGFLKGDVATIEPGLTINDLGPVSLPLSKADAERIASVSRKAPYGKGTETLVDESVRKTWEIDAGKFGFANTSWDQRLKDMLRTAVRGLGLERDRNLIQAKPYKLLLYGEGAHFKPHRDTEKIPGMFGTLAICLPSEHDGGDLVLSHGDDRIVFQSKDTSLNQVSFAAWYADVLHEVKPVTQGYRLVLTYNLALEDAMLRPSAHLSCGKDKKLEALLRAWSTALDADVAHDVPIYLAHVLEHKYTQANLQLDKLKGRDREVAIRAQTACEQSECMIFLATLEHMHGGGCDEDEEEGYDPYEEEDEDENDEDCEDDEDDEDNVNHQEHSRTSDSGYESDEYLSRRLKREGFDWHRVAHSENYSTELRVVHTLDGTLAAKKIAVEKQILLRKGLFKDRAPDDEDYSGFTGNEGVSTTHWYNDTILLILPKKAHRTLALGSHMQNIASLEKTFRTAIQEFRQTENDMSVKSLAFLCRFCVNQEEKFRKDRSEREYRWYHSTSFPSRHAHITSIASGCAALNLPNLFTRLVKSIRSDWPPNVFAVICSHLRGGEERLDEWLDCFEEMVASFSTISDQYEALNTLHDSVESHPDDEFRACMNLKLQSFIQSAAKKVVPRSSPVESLWLSDTNGLAGLVGRYNRHDLLPWVVETAKPHMQESQVSIPFLAGFLKTTRRFDPSDSANVGAAMMPLLRMATESFSLEKGPIKDPCTAQDYGTPHPYWQARSYNLLLPSGYPGERPIYQPGTDAANMGGPSAQFYGETLRVDEDLNEQLRQNLVREMVKSLPEQSLVAFIRNFIPDFIAGLKDNGIDFSSGPHQQLFQHLTEVYFSRTSRPPPDPQAGFKRKPVDCSCKDCSELNKFLNDKNEAQWRYKASKAVRRHLESALGQTQSADQNTCRTDKIPVGNRYELVVKKRPDLYQFLWNLWVTDMNDFKTSFCTGLLSADLRALLPAEFFDASGSFIVPERFGPQPSPDQPMMRTGTRASTTAQRATSSKGKKRTAEVIDLTGSPGRPSKVQK